MGVFLFLGTSLVHFLICHWSEYISTWGNCLLRATIIRQNYAATGYPMIIPSRSFIPLTIMQVHLPVGAYLCSLLSITLMLTMHWWSGKGYCFLEYAASDIFTFYTINWERYAVYPMLSFNPSTCTYLHRDKWLRIRIDRRLITQLVWIKLSTRQLKIARSASHLRALIGNIVITLFNCRSLAATQSDLTTAATAFATICLCTRGLCKVLQHQVNGQR